MPDFIDHVTQLTQVRDRTSLDRWFCDALFDAAQAPFLCLWRLVKNDGDVKLREQIRLTAEYGEIPQDASPADIADLPGLASHPLLLRSYQLRQDLQTFEKMRFHYIYLLPDDRDPLSIVEVDSHFPLSVGRVRAIEGLIRICGNQSALLDYGDRDELTKLFNRRTFDESVKHISWPALRARWGTSAMTVKAHLAVADIDLFKRINDTFGHPYGDEVLVLLARLMEKSFRDTDFLFRFGGEEFVIILPGTTAVTAEQTLERFRAAVEAFPFPQVGRVTISIGFTAILGGDTGSDAFGRADEALYVAKNSGRNKTCCYEILTATGLVNQRQAAEDDVELF